MRVKNYSLLAVAVAAGLSLTACQNDDTASTTTDAAPVSSESSAASSGDTEPSGTNASTNGDTGAGVSSDTCTTDQLTATQKHGMGEGDILVHLKNTSDAACDLKGFPGVDLRNDDDSVSAARTDLEAPLVTIAAGDEARFTLHYTPNTSGGSGVTFDTLVVTPPNETHSLTIPVSVNLAVTESTEPALRVDPVGTGK
ncbi:DUF4232 domain-containing protein [Streptomyces sp. NPDC023723]|uniref:DUF4232 domain-containing protein n=1 Tax=Streptomyces sp. NPDC023723 TaxID=3154323 RepID=UPI00340C57A1